MSAKTRMGGLNLETRNGPQEGGQPGHAVAPNDVEPSLIVGPLGYTGDLKMPLARRRSNEVVLDFEGWIRMGFPDPSEVEVWVPCGTIDLEQGRKHWAIQASRPAQAPSAKGRAWPERDQEVGTNLFLRKHLRLD